MAKFKMVIVKLALQWNVTKIEGKQLLCCDYGESCLKIMNQNGYLNFLNYDLIQFERIEMDSWFGMEMSLVHLRFYY